MLLPLARRASDANLMARALLRRDRDLTAPPVVERPPEPLLMIAPHADDESIGCGGTLALSVNATVVVLTGNDIRRREAEAAAGVLGVELAFLDLADGRIPDVGVSELDDVVARRRPACVLIPYPHDRHSDHARAARLSLRAVLDIQTAIWFYEVWSPLEPNRLVDISSVADAKRAAIAAHVSQIEGLDYVEAALGLNRYRALLAPGATYAEAFLTCDVSEAFALAGISR